MRTLFLKVKVLSIFYVYEDCKMRFGMHLRRQ